VPSPTDDEAAAEPDPAISYPRGNRLGLRHPRPTVVIVVAVIVVVGGAFLWQAAVTPAEGRFCDLAGLVGSPTADSPEAAVQAWLDDPERPRTTTETRYGELPAPTSVDQFTREGDSWIYRVGDAGLKVDIGPGYRVVAANECGWQAM
jgi:hypothetical protein